jgi:DNA-binding response OmpR family regulator
MSMRILLVEDHERLANYVKIGLEKNRFLVDIAGNGEEALLMLEESHYEAVILDLGLPDCDGLDVLRTLRRRSHTIPVLVLTSRIDTADKVVGLNAGADDYLAKPFALEELIARLHALLRRPQEVLGSALVLGNLEFDTGARAVRVGDRNIEFSRREMELLEHLMRRSGRVLPKSVLASTLSSRGDELSTNTLEVLVHRVRKKLRSSGALAKIHTVHGVGYMMADLES